MARFEGRGNWLHGSFDRPRGFVITIGNLGNDTDLCGAYVDYDAVRITFDWRAAFDLFYNEMWRIHQWDKNQGLDPKQMYRFLSLPEGVDVEEFWNSECQLTCTGLEFLGPL